MPSDRLYIATQDPREGGGVKSMVKFVYEVASEAGYDPCLVYNDLDRQTQIRLNDPLKYVRFDPSESIRSVTVDGMEGKAIRLVFPEIEFTQYVLNRKGWREATDDGDLFFAVGGTNHCCVPFVRAGKSFGSWTATLLWEDRVDRLRSASILERVRDRLSRPVLERFEAKAYREADPVLVLSDYTANQIVEKYDVPPEELDVLPFPVDAERFSPEGRENDPTPDGPVILFVGRLTDPRKNIELLFDAFARVRASVSDAELWLIGSEPNERLRTVVDRHEITDAVEFFGHIENDQLPSYYRAADVFAIPSNQEGLAIVGLEAMACGTPVVSTRCGGPEQYVHDEETGYLVETNEAAELAKRLETLLNDSTLRREMGDRARTLIERDYSKSVIKARFLEAFEELGQ